MATILPFVIRPGMHGMPRARQADADIIIFPGVRYEQQSGGGAANAPKANAPRRRKSKSS